jgi:hypothetical protein
MLLVGPGAIVGGKLELLGVREAAPDGGLFILKCAAGAMPVCGTNRTFNSRSEARLRGPAPQGRRVYRLQGSSRHA